MSFFHQERFSGAHRSKNYFEGYYFRCVSKEGKTFVAIPGISKSTELSHSFIQIIDCNNRSFNFTYPATAFEYSAKKLFFNVGSSSFSDEGMRLHINGDIKVEGFVSFSDLLSLPKSVFTPGIMGPFSYIPGLECRHEVVAVKCKLSGAVTVGGETINLDGGTGYIEKDFGTSFPKDYIWAETNTFTNSDAAFMFSAACVPVANKNVRGLIAYLYTSGRFYRFATYYGDKIRTVYQSRNKTEIELSSQKKTLRVTLLYDRSGALKAPTRGEMSREIRECVGGTAEIELFDSQRQVFYDTGCYAGIEICGNTHNL